MSKLACSKSIRQWRRSVFSLRTDTRHGRRSLARWKCPVQTLAYLGNAKRVFLCLLNLMSVCITATWSHLNWTEFSLPAAPTLDTLNFPSLVPPNFATLSSTLIDSIWIPCVLFVFGSLHLHLVFNLILWTSRVHCVEWQPYLPVSVALSSLANRCVLHYTRLQHSVFFVEERQFRASSQITVDNSPMQFILEHY